MAENPEVTEIGLWNKEVTPENYPAKELYFIHCLEQYKIYVEMTDRISARRNIANTFFLTLQTFLITAAGFAYAALSDKNKSVVFLPLIAGLALCYSWWRLVKSYRQLNTAKFKVIGEFEKRLPASPYWSAEWKALGEGKDPKRYTPLSALENWIPVIFGFLYFFGAVLLLFSH